MKSNTKIVLLNLLAFVVVFSLCITVVVADEGDTGTASGGITNPLGEGNDSLSDLFNNIVAVLIELGTIVSVLGIMYGGFLYTTAQGDEEKLGKAYKTITWALVGTAVLLGARTILAAISDTVGQLA